MTGLSRFIFGRIELVEEEVMTMVEQNAFLDKQQFTAFKPLAHRPKPMLAKP
ncbi:hypothetical protein [Mitsuokella jalaludinii]|uniref:hypothetical protein n=1 Tax=Mitsuokella jalaludinii TaxID=187979 RepID=UPI0020D01E01|nr:hypothetical protein [Mitsuokella jalaludinii]MCQ1533153.1 hypothetical protein [Mitsuokella jalaludinii]